MATRSLIGLQEKDGTIKYVYCHWDGYLEGVGAMLLKHYNTESKLRELLSRGDISTLGETIADTVFYNQKMYPSEVSSVYDFLLSTTRGGTTYQYLFFYESDWHVFRRSDNCAMNLADELNIKIRGEKQQENHKNEILPEEEDSIEEFFEDETNYLSEDVMQLIDLWYRFQASSCKAAQMKDTSSEERWVSLARADESALEDMFEKIAKYMKD